MNHKEQKQELPEEFRKNIIHIHAKNKGYKTIYKQLHVVLYQFVDARENATPD